MPLTSFISNIVKNIPYDPLLPLRFSDNDFTSDKITSKSIYGYLFIIAGGPVSWKLKRNSIITLLIIETEFNALTEVIRKTQWLRNLYSELNRPIKSPTLILKNNQSIIKAIKDLALHSRIKYTLLKYYYIKKTRQAGIFNILYIDTKRIPANGLIKPLNDITYQKFLNLISLNPI